MRIRLKWFPLTSVLALAIIGAACDPAPIDQGAGGSGGDGVSSSGTGGSGGATGGSGGATGGSGGGGGGSCDPMNLPAEGSPCSTEGEFCSPGCEDPCSFCNVMQCSNGKWTHLEVFPAQCLSCEDVCVPVVAAQCTGGPPDQMACVQGCNQQQMACKIAFNQMLACIGPSPTFTCDAMSRPTVTGCEMQFDKLYACIMP
ncbi:MAG: hypothetical protein IPM54_01260 [Polyangiaceae bacterium]|nr:hypothetical protein [Polyangiaceae bacterium]